MQTFQQPGDVMTLIAPYAVASGGGFMVGSLFAVAQDAADNAATVVGVTRGVFTLAKTSAQAWTVGAKLYWDNTNKVATTTASGNTLIGVAAAVAANPSPTGLVWVAGQIV